MAASAAAASASTGTSAPSSWSASALSRRTAVVGCANRAMPYSASASIAYCPAARARSAAYLGLPGRGGEFPAGGHRPGAAQFHAWLEHPVRVGPESVGARHPISRGRGVPGLRSHAGQLGKVRINPGAWLPCPGLGMWGMAELPLVHVPWWTKCLTVWAFR